MATPVPASKLTYTEAMTELEQILAHLQSNSPDIDTLTEKTARAKALIARCRTQLLKTEEKLKKL